MIIEYDYVYDQKIVNDNLNEFLLISDEESLYFGYGKPNEKVSIETVFNDDFTVNLISYFIVNPSHDGVFFLGTKFPPKKILTKDIFEPIKWKLLDGQKEILGFKCKMAQCDFRGRSYMVWYTPEIPSQQGPWKFSGLPGLILEVIDQKDIHNYYARRIIQNSETNVPAKFLNYIEDKKKNVISFESYIPKENEYLQKINSQVRASFPSGTVFTENQDKLREYEKEVTFEW